MKKIFTLLVTTLVTMSMFATNPVTKQRAIASKPAVTTRHNAPTEGQTIDVTFDNSSEPTFEYYPETGDWYIGWVDATSTYILRLDYLTTEDGKYGHYTIADLDLDFSWFSDYSSGSRLDLNYTDADITIADEGEGSFSLRGYVVCDNGNTYNLNGYYEVPKPLVATPSVTSFSTLDDLAGMTITFTGSVPELQAYPDGVYVGKLEEGVVYGYAPFENCTFEDNVLTISGFNFDEGLTASLPEEEGDVQIFITAMFKDQDHAISMNVHYTPDTDRPAANAVVEKIEAIGEVEYTADSKALIDAAREAYDELTEAQKALVTEEQLKVLTDAEAKYAELEAAAADQAAAEAVVEKIEAIGEVEYTADCKALIDAAREAYDELTEAQQALVTEEQLKVLTDAEAKYAELEAAAEKEAADQAAAEAVVEKIEAIGEVEYTEDCKALIDAAREAYDALTEDQKALVTEEQLKVLTDAEEKYAELEAAAEKEAADQAAAEAVVEKIEAIGIVEYTEGCKALIDAAREAYDALTEDQKALVTEEQLKVLTDAEEEYERLQEIATGVCGANTVATLRDGKFIENNKVVVVKNNAIFDAMGKRIK